MRVGLETLHVASLMVRGVHPRPQPQDPELYATAEAFARARASGQPFREVYREVGREIKQGRFTPGAPGGDAVPDAEIDLLQARWEALQPG